MENSVIFDQIHVGEWFCYKNKLYIKTRAVRYNGLTYHAVDLSTGIPSFSETFFCFDRVVDRFQKSTPLA